MCEGYDPVGEQNKDRWINCGVFNSKEDFTDKKSCTLYTWPEFSEFYEV